MPTFSPPISPAVGSPINVEFKLLRNNFGDGYEQVAGDGLNYIRRSWELTFDVLSDAEVQEIEDFFVTTVTGYQSFEYTLPGEVTARTWRLDGDSIKKDPLPGGLWKCTLKIKEAFVL